MLRGSFCTNCGTRMSPQATRCGSCGAIAPADDLAVPTEAVPVVTDHSNGLDRPSRRGVVAAGAVATLEVIRGPNAGARYILGEEVTLGRSPDSGIFLDDVSVSRQHATIVMLPPRLFVVTDAGSLNGTYVNDDRVDQATLHHGDILQIGMFKMAFATGSE